MGFFVCGQKYRCRQSNIAIPLAKEKWLADYLVVAHCASPARPNLQRSYGTYKWLQPTVIYDNRRLGNRILSSTVQAIAQFMQPLSATQHYSSRLKKPGKNLTGGDPDRGRTGDLRLDSITNEDISLFHSLTSSAFSRHMPSGADQCDNFLDLPSCLSHFHASVSNPRHLSIPGQLPQGFQ